MKKVLSSERKPIKMWLDDVEESALAQAKNIANLPFLFKHVAIMPDAHLGYGCPIGSVVATENVVCPNLVGVDIGCGVCAVKTNLENVDQEIIKKIFGVVRATVPVGMKHHSKKQDINWMPDATDLPENLIVVEEFESAQKQVGTLGGGK
jgi:tRNA-splicing ligase RtcB